GTYLKDKPKESDSLKFNSVKTFYDGTFTSETALMYETYKNSKSNGERIHSKEDWQKLLKKVRDNKLNISIHTIGNRAFDEVVSSLKQYPPLTGIDRIIHASSIKLESLDNLKGMNVALDLQPQFISSDLPWAYNKFESKPILYPFKSMLNNNLQMALSSDAPVEIPNPLLGIYSAVTRNSNYTYETFDMNESLTIKEAFDRYTKDAAKT